MGEIHIVEDVFISDLYANDESFEEELLLRAERELYQPTEEDKEEAQNEKDDYYHGDFWYDCDYILRKDKETIGCIKINNEIILDQLDDYTEPLSEEEEKAIIAFYDDEQFKKKKNNEEFEEQSTWPHDIEESDQKMNNAHLAIKYRGGQGYYYSWWILIK